MARQKNPNQTLLCVCVFIIIVINYAIIVIILRISKKKLREYRFSRLFLLKRFSKFENLFTRNTSNEC